MHSFIQEFRVMSEKFLSSGKAAEYLGISLSTLYRMEKNKELTVTKTQGGQRRFAIASLDDYLQRNTISEGNKSSPNKSNFNTESKVVPNETTSLEPVITDNEDQIDISKPVDPRNSLNDLNGTQWLPLTKSFLYQKGLGLNTLMHRLSDSIQLPIPFKISLN